MKTMRKMVLGASVGALALVAVSGINADAATVDKAKKLTGISAGDSVSFDAIKVAKSGTTYNAKAKWDLYETANASADLSNVNTTKKDVYFATKSATGTVEIYKALADTQKKFKATCDGTKITILVDGKELANTDTKWSQFSWRTENSAWTSFTTNTDLDLTPYTMQGATIYIRYMGATAVSATPASPAEEIDVNGTKVQVKNIAADSFPEKEFKVKVPKKANAPAINVDYVKGVIKKNKNAVTAKVAALSSVSTAQWSEKMTEDLAIDNSSAATILMRIPADTAKKKAASKIAFFTYPMAATAPTVTYSAPTQDATTGAITGNKTGDIVANALSYEAKDNKNVAKATFTITNKTTGDTGVTYEIFKAKTGTTTPDGNAVATLKPGKSVVLTSAKVSADTSLIIRVAGDKAKATLPGAFSTSTTLKPVYLKTPEAASN